MRTPLLLCLAILPALPGCYAGPRSYHYDIQLRNTSDRTVAMELLQAEHSNITKVRADLGPGGLYSRRYTTCDSTDYLEARFRFPDSAPDSPWFIHELPRGQTRSDISIINHHITLTPTPPSSPLIRDAP